LEIPTLLKEGDLEKAIHSVPVNNERRLAVEAVSVASHEEIILLVCEVDTQGKVYLDVEPQCLNPIVPLPSHHIFHCRLVFSNLPGM
jgi:hypothetical protein